MTKVYMRAARVRRNERMARMVQKRKMGITYLEYWIFQSVYF